MRDLTKGEPAFLILVITSNGLLCSCFERSWLLSEGGGLSPRFGLCEPSFQLEENEGRLLSRRVDPNSARGERKKEGVVGSYLASKTREPSEGSLLEPRLSLRQRLIGRQVTWGDRRPVAGFSG